MKKYTLFFLLLLIYSNSYSQKELWGVYEGSGFNYPGAINKFDINGQNPENIHEFISFTEGHRPSGKLFLASNGKLYGTTYYGGSTSNNNFPNGQGVLYEYDLILNKYAVAHYFDIPNNPNNAVPQGIGLIEPIIGKLYGVNNQKPFSYNINTEEYLTGNNLAEYYVGGELMLASNGFLYGTTSFAYPCPFVNPLNYMPGTIFKINMQTLNLQTVYRFNCGYTDGVDATGGLIETLPGKLFGTATYGGDINISAGTLFEFNIVNNVFTRKITFDDNNLGAYPLPLVNGNNGKLYGVCKNGGTYTQNNGTVVHFGTLFEYVPANNTITKLHDFGLGGAGGFTGLNPVSIMKTSTGKFMITSFVCSPSVFDPSNNSVALTCDGICNASLEPGVGYNKVNLIEICRKPSYQEFLPNTYAPEQGTAFTYNIQNTNATTYVWKKDITVLPAQITGILSLPSVTTNDTGVYTCTMTNECGETITMPLNINVTNLATENIDNYKEFITLHPNPTKGSINLKFPENRGMKAISYKVANLLGQVVSENDIAKNNTATTLTIDTAGFANGIYQVTLATDKGNWNGKFVKE